MKMSAEGGLREKPRIQHVEEEIDVKKGDQVVKIAEFNREKKKKEKKWIYLSRSAHEVQLSKTCWLYKASGGTKTLVQLQNGVSGRNYLQRERERPYTSTTWIFKITL